MYVVLCTQVLSAQDTLSLKINFENFELDSIEYQKQFLSKKSLTLAIKDVITQLEQSSFLEVKLLSLTNDETQFLSKIHVGPSYNWLEIRNNNIPDLWLNQLNIELSKFKKSPINAKHWLDLKYLILDYAQNHGYPFAQIKLDSILNDKHTISGVLTLKKNELFTFGEIIILGEAGISSQYIKQYLNIKNGDIYKQELVDGINPHLSNLPFVNIIQSPKLSFKDKKANIHLYLKRKPLNRFDIIFGVAPNDNVLDPRKIIFTGQGNMDLYNSFKHGERIQLAFEYLEKGTQSVDLNASYPYLFQLPFGGEAGFGLYKKDTTYLDVKYKFGLSYQLSKYQTIKVFFNNIASNLLNIDKERLIQTKQLPNVLDISKTSFGIQFNILALDYRFNPRKGWDIKIVGSFGQKNIHKNGLITDLKIENEPNFKFESLYETLNLQQNQYQFSTDISYFIPLFKRSVFLTRLASEGIFGDDSLFENELIRLGGASRIRGFNEDQFLASFYSALTFEYRWILQKNAHFFLFSDLGYLESEQNNMKSFHRPLGFGTGIRFETKAGIFGLSTAIGRDFALENSFFDFRSPKIHFGFLSLF